MPRDTTPNPFTNPVAEERIFFSLRPGHSVSVVLNNDVAVIEIQEEGTINFEKVDTRLLISFNGLRNKCILPRHFGRKKTLKILMIRISH